MWNDAPQRFPLSIEETWIARSPLRRSKAISLPFLPRAWRSVDLSDVDRVVASSHAFAHHLAARAAEDGMPSYAYVHTPARYVWAPEFDDRGQSRLARAGRSYFKRLDRRATSSNVNYAANSEFVRGRIAKAWDQSAAVIYPPVEVTQIQSKPDWRAEVSDVGELKQLVDLPTDFVLGASRLVEYKRLDTAIEVGELLNLPVVIAGSGPDELRLRHIASSSSVPVHFFGYASTEALYALYQAASLFVFMAIEDFGIMPVEAMALGTPVLVNDTGGAKESVTILGGGAAVVPYDGDLHAVAEGVISIDMRAAIDGSRAFSLESFNHRVKAWVGESSSPEVA